MSEYNTKKNSKYILLELYKKTIYNKSECDRILVFSSVENKYLQLNVEEIEKEWDLSAEATNEIIKIKLQKKIDDRYLDLIVAEKGIFWIEPFLKVLEERVDGCFTISGNDFSCKQGIKVTISDKNGKGKLIVSLKVNEFLNIEKSFFYNGYELVYVVRANDGRVLQKPKSLIFPMFEFYKPYNVSVYNNKIVSRRINVYTDRVRVLQSKDNFNTAHVRFLVQNDSNGPIPESLRFSMGKQITIIVDKNYSRSHPATDCIENAIYGGVMDYHYGHFIIETLSRLWFAKDNPELPIVWLNKGGEVRDWQKQIFEMLGIRNQHIFIGSPTIINNAWYPYPGCCIGSYFESFHGNFLGVVKPNEVISGKKIYISRSNILGRTSSSELDYVFKNHGFEIFHPEEFSLIAQLEILSSAELVVGVEGSAFHSLIFFSEPPKTRYVAIGRHRLGEGVFEHIKKAKKLNYNTIDVRVNNCKKSAYDDVEYDLGLIDSILACDASFGSILNDTYNDYVLPNAAQSNYQSLLGMAKLYNNINEREAWDFLNFNFNDSSNSLKSPVFFPVLENN